MAHRTLLSLTLASTLALTAASARAEPSLSDRETARSLMDEGDAKRDKGDFKAALKSYEAADAIMRVPTTGLDVARMQAQLGLLLEARETLARVLRLTPKPGEPPAFTSARKAAEALNADLSARIPTITVVITNADPAQPPTLVFDGEPVPSAASQAPRKVNPGKHTVVVRAGATEKKEEIISAERESKTVTVDLKAVEPKDELVQPSTKESPLPTALIFGGFALGAVGVGIGAVTGLMSISAVDDVKKDCVNDVCPAARQQDIDSAKSLGTISTIAFIAGGLGIGAGVVGLILKSKQSAETPPVARVQADIGPTWLGVRGSF
jgi:hypothetical protein